MRRSLLRILPWVVTAGLLFLVFRRISIDEVIADTRHAAGWTVPLILASVVAVYLGDSFAIWKTFGWFLTRMSFVDVLLVRGATYLLAAINYNVGQGAIVYFVKKVFGVPVVRGIATVLLIMGVNVLALLFLATAGLRLAPEVPHYGKMLVLVAWAGLAVYALAVVLKPRFLAERAVLQVLLTAGFGGHARAIYVVLVAVRPRWLDRPVFEVLLNAGFAGHARALLVRLPHIAALVTFQFTALRGFGVHVPLVNALAALPVTFLVAVLPISVQGLGTTQATMVYFFARYASGSPAEQEAAVVAASIVAQAIALAFQAILGVSCLKTRVGRAMQASAKDAAPAAAAPGA